jgi:uncharacterized ferredoxin-like protein
MPQYDYTQHLLEVARMMELAARTAPKSKGQDFIEVKIITGDTIKKLADDMVAFGKDRKKENFDRDAKNIAGSPVVVLMGIAKSTTLGLDCSACGYVNCNELTKAASTNADFNGPLCTFRHLDFGIAMGSAVKTAQMMNVDNRIMYRIGVVARNSGLVNWDVVMGIPLSATGKNIYFDRGTNK